ncbi:hypothetical protein VTL71DRAFT_10207 [Oculimacula yallundae]|jgi:hypothetical protein
MLEN